MEDASSALALAPGNADFLVMRAMAATASGRDEMAIQDLNQVLLASARIPNAQISNAGAPDVGRGDALVLRAGVWRRRNRLDLASADMDRAIALDPDDPEALLERGILRQRLGDLDGARADWEHARAVDPNGPVADLAEQNLALLEAGPKRR
jgi:tetratricopeptide (TPR) repeat protein